VARLIFLTAISSWKSTGKEYGKRRKGESTKWMEVRNKVGK
jgi:hypothetical protein